MNTNEEIKMKRINYFGKEYAVSDDVEWVATNSYGTVMAFRYEPIPTGSGWAGGVYEALARFPTGSIDWENSLREVKDIIVKKNELKIGDKVMVNHNTNGFKEGQIVEVYRLDSDGCHLFKGDNDTFPRMCGIHDGAFLSPSEYTIIGDTKPHPHADLMLKYAMIAQYDDKPWESFEFKNQYTHSWMGVVDHPCWDAENEYRLKPQEPKIQIGQIWVSKEGVEVTVSNLANKLVFTKIEAGGLTIPWSFKQGQFLSNFKLK